MNKSSDDVAIGFFFKLPYPDSSLEDDVFLKKYEDGMKQRKSRLFEHISEQELKSLETAIAAWNAHHRVIRLLDLSAPQSIIEREMEKRECLLRGTEVYSPVGIVALQKILSKGFDESIKIHNNKKLFLAEILQKWSEIKSKKEDVYASGRIAPGSAFSKQ